MSDRRADAYVEKLAALGIEIEAREMTESTHTAQQAAEAIGCPVEAIVKSLLFRAGDDFVLVLASGPHRVDTDLVGALVGAPVSMADAKSVKLVTGYSIGGVPPLAHAQQLPTILDETLLLLPEVWAAAGSANSVFPIAPGRLVELAGARVGRVS
ncbi:prolyl-tRNA editing enzyme YbaK/EbsC (Cys-tRNA(Pro) deacylase) [Leifsonia sp. AK011]|uniref:YbaK/EbsC family protein n=1 Tax=Leifsonia sp. AK011 TaxID=2723075 RepID=UPI0017DD4012|nr:YbaK/EbsC family protein [Leifsonia sp. AK011]NYF10685.1 prolyl-tRNA editing enzyme YbaK/EbsC (Cys-tRNA(Pro) deacylase) [Leifsonia sp. AK011]